jgi:hypothetical protein
MAVTSVSSGIASISLLAVNRNRKQATIRNTDANTLYVLLDSGTASSTNHTVALATGDYYETPLGYKGDIFGIWASDGAGVALVTEF